MSFNYGLRPGTTQKLSPSGSSVATSTGFGSQTEYVRVAADADVHIVFGGSPTATANDIFLHIFTC
jgi:methylmalonyl-CoA mutase cobalamin-binding subunit